jgi:hypothetical protein
VKTTEPKVVDDSSIVAIGPRGIELRDASIDFAACAESFAAEQGRTVSRCVAERNIATSSPYFQFFTDPVPTRIVFRPGNRLVEFVSCRSAARRFHDLQRRIGNLGWTTYDLS